MSKPSWGFSVGAVKARETELFARQEIEQMLALSDEAALLSYLHDKGYGGSGSTAATVSALLTEETEALWRYAMTTAADPSVFACLLVGNDIHNLKAAIKGNVAGRPYAHLFLRPTLTDTALLDRAVKEKDYALLPDFLAEDTEKAVAALTETADPTLSDGILDRCGMAAETAFAKETGSAFIKRYVSCRVFYQNSKIALRGAMAGKPLGFYEAVLFSDGTFDVTELAKAALTGTDAVLTYMTAMDPFGPPESADLFRRSPTAYEKATDDRLMAVAREAKGRNFGPDVILGYTLGKLAELRAVGIIASSLRTGAGEKETRERLRELYD